GGYLDKQLRRGPEQLAAAEPQVEVIRRGAGCAQRAVEREAVAVRQLEPLRQHHLEHVAGVDVPQRAPDCGLELLLAAGDRLGLGQAAALLASEEPRAQRLRGGRAQRIGEATSRESF